MSRYATTVLTSNINSRPQTDRRLYFLTDGILLPIITIGIWSLVVLYRNIKRHDEHFRRESALNNDLLHAVKDRIQAAGVDPLSLPEIAALESAIRQKAESEQPKGAALWLILTLISGLAGIYVIYFLTVDYFHHEQRQIDIVNKANAAFASAGLPISMRYDQRLPQRHFWLNLLVNIATIGIWGIIWSYRLLSDPNRHFENQWQWEDNLARYLA